jgi:prevent-host-death family protein
MIVVTSGGLDLMDRVGIRELKAHLSRHLKRVRSGARLLVTERGRVIASVEPVETPHGLEWAHALVAAGRAQWSGGKPEGCRCPVATTEGRTVSAVVLEERR